MRLKTTSVSRLNKLEYQVNFVEFNNNVYQYIVVADSPQHAIRKATEKYIGYKEVVNAMYS